MEFNVLSNIAEWTQNLEDIYLRQVPYATAMALNDTVEEVKAFHQTVLLSTFDRPTRYTLNSLQLLKASGRRELRAAVLFKEHKRSRQHYLMPQVQGGSREHKPFEKWLISRGIMASNEFAVPASSLKLNAYGNISQGTIQQILSQMAAGPDAFQWETARSKRRAGSARSRYFVPQPGSKLRRGIWRRKGKKAIEPVLIFVTSPVYSKRYPFFQLSQEKATELFPSNFQRRMDEAIGDQQRYRISQGLAAPHSKWRSP